MIKLSSCKQKEAGLYAGDPVYAAAAPGQRRDAADLGGVGFPSFYRIFCAGIRLGTTETKGQRSVLLLTTVTDLHILYAHPPELLTHS